MDDILLLIGSDLQGDEVGAELAVPLSLIRGQAFVLRCPYLKQGGSFIAIVVANVDCVMLLDHG